MPRGIPRGKTELLECLAMLRKTLKHEDSRQLPLEFHEYWEGAEDVLRKLCIEASTSVYQTFMKERRSILEFAERWEGDDISKAMLKGKLLMLRVEKGKEKEWQDHFILVDIKEIREMLSRKKFQGKEPVREYVEVYQDELDENTRRIIELNRKTRQYSG